MEKYDSARLFNGVLIQLHTNVVMHSILCLHIIFNVCTIKMKGYMYNAFCLLFLSNNCHVAVYFLVLTDV